MFLPPAMKFAKVMFLHLSVSHSVHGGGMVSQHVLQSPGPHPWGKLRVWPGGEWLSHAQQMATAAGGTHPTGMHSCCKSQWSLETYFAVLKKV